MVCASPGPEINGGGCGAGEGAEDETNNSKFAKRTWNVPWNQRLDFLGSRYTVADWGRGQRG